MSFSNSREKYLSAQIFFRERPLSKNKRRAQKRRFLQAHSVCQRFGLWEESEFAELHNMRALKNAAKREKTPIAARRAAVSFSNSRKKYLSAQIFFREQISI